MNNKKILILLSAILLLMTSCSLFQLIEWGFEDKKDNSIYPSAVLALAGYDENNEVDVQNSKRNQSIRVLKDYVSIYLVPKDDNTKIEVEVKESEYWYASKAVFTCDKADDRYIYKPVINWKYDVLRKLSQPTPVNMVVQLTVNGEDAANVRKR
jgi:flagellar basal body-associated protein FliL